MFTRKHYFPDPNIVTQDARYPVQIKLNSAYRFYQAYPAQSPQKYIELDKIAQLLAAKTGLEARTTNGGRELNLSHETGVSLWGKIGFRYPRLTQRVFRSNDDDMKQRVKTALEDPEVWKAMPYQPSYDPKTKGSGTPYNAVATIELNDTLYIFKDNQVSQKTIEPEHPGDYIRARAENRLEC